MSEPNWDDLHTPEQWADNLAEMAESVAHRYGEYSMCAEMKLAAQCIRDQAETIEKAARAADSLAATIEETQRKTKAALESLSRLP